MQFLKHSKDPTRELLPIRCGHRRVYSGGSAESGLPTCLVVGRILPKILKMTLYIAECFFLILQIIVFGSLLDISPHSALM